VTALKTAVQVAGLSKPGAAFSTAIVCTPGRFVFVSGLLARGDDGAIVGKCDIAAQTRCICENLRRVLVAAGGTLDSVVRLDIHVTALDQRDSIYAVRREIFANEPRPTSTMVQVSGFVDPDALIEITAIAVLP